MHQGSSDNKFLYNNRCNDVVTANTSDTYSGNTANNNIGSNNNSNSNSNSTRIIQPNIISSTNNRNVFNRNQLPPINFRARDGHSDTFSGPMSNNNVQMHSMICNNNAYPAGTTYPLTTTMARTTSSMAVSQYQSNTNLYTHSHSHSYPSSNYSELKVPQPTAPLFLPLDTSITDAAAGLLTMRTPPSTSSSAALNSLGSSNSNPDLNNSDDNDFSGVSGENNCHDLFGESKRKRSRFETRNEESSNNGPVDKKYKFADISKIRNWMRGDFDGEKDKSSLFVPYPSKNYLQKYLQDSLLEYYKENDQFLEDGYFFKKKQLEILSDESCGKNVEADKGIKIKDDKLENINKTKLNSLIKATNLANSRQARFIQILTINYLQKILKISKLPNNTNNVKNFNNDLKTKICDPNIPNFFKSMLEIKIFSINSNKICNSTPPISRFQILINLQFLNLGGVVKTNKQLLDLLDKLLIENKDLNIDEYGLLAKHVDVQVKQIN